MMLNVKIITYLLQVGYPKHGRAAVHTSVTGFVLRKTPPRANPLHIDRDGFLS